MTTSERMVDVAALEVGFWRCRVLRQLDLGITPGSITALLGRNGAGKTTLLRVLLGFMRARAGQVRVLGRDAWLDRFALKDEIGFVADRQDFWPRMTGADVLWIAAGLYCRWDSQRVATLVERFRLPLDRAVRHYSKGMQTLLALTVALGHEPRLLLMDEPVAGLDPLIRSQFTEELLGYVQATGAAVLYSTHLVDEVGTLADGVAVLEGGRIVLRGETQDLVGRYSRLTVVFGTPAPDPTRAGVEVLASSQRDEVAILTVGGEPQEAARRLGAGGVTVLEARRPTLQELFVAFLSAADAGTTFAGRAQNLHQEVA